mmetsp:Transcript_143684/g.459770  ORF Transcript_143684/g.459770 Transcript_143684/m.459770 type:complete len:326 (+) Transcript_143684:747-1724(+)
MSCEPWVVQTSLQRPPLSGVFAEHPLDELLRGVGDPSPGRGIQGHGEGARQAATQQLVQHNAQAPDVARQAVLVSPHLGRRIGHGAHDISHRCSRRTEACHSEIDELRVALLEAGGLTPGATAARGGEDTVAGLDVPVGEVVGRVQVMYCRKKLSHHRRSATLLEAPHGRDALLEFATGAELHADVQVPGVFEDFIEPCYVRVIQQPQNLHFVTDPCQAPAIAPPLGYALHRTQLACWPVVALLHPSKGALAEFSLAGGLVDLKVATSTTLHKEVTVEALCSSRRRGEAWPRLSPCRIRVCTSILPSRQRRARRRRGPTTSSTQG